MMVLTQDDFEALSDTEKKAWSGYVFKMSYETITPESAEEGDAEERGWEFENSERYNSLEDLLNESHVVNHSWVEWSSSHPTSRDWLVSECEENYRTGGTTDYHLWIERWDNEPLSREEMAYISKNLGVKF